MDGRIGCRMEDIRSLLVTDSIARIFSLQRKRHGSNIFSLESLSFFFLKKTTIFYLMEKGEMKGLKNLEKK